MLRSLALLACLCGPLLGQAHPHKASPFDEVRWKADRPEVQVDGDWYALLRIGTTEIDAIVAEIDGRWGRGARDKRFAEDLMEVLANLGDEPGGLVDLEVRELSGGTTTWLRDVPNTGERRQRLARAHSVVRGFMAATRHGHAGGMGPFGRAEAEADLRAFAKALRERFAYLELRGVDLDAELQRVADGLPAEPTRHDLLGPLSQLLNRFGDGHARLLLEDRRSTDTESYLPILLGDSAAGVVAFREDRAAFIDPEHPLVRSIDGFPIDACLAAAAADVTAGSPQLVRERSLRLLRHYGLWRPRLGDGVLPAHIEVQLASLDGERHVTARMRPAPRKRLYGDWPLTRSRRLGDSLGYLRLASMGEDGPESERASEEVHRAMARVRGTRGLIVDVRGNGGGSRAALIALAGYLAEREAGPWVANVAAHRVPAFPDDHLESRFLHRADWSGWSEAEAAAIAALDFEPEWSLPEGFSAWHYLVLGPTGDPREYAYDGEVVVLSDAACFSATDIFLGGLELLPQVTLMGTPSAGGSARSVRVELPGSGIEVVCASMASFRPDGRLYDGRGVEVDVRIEADPGFYLEGGADRVLAAAIERLGGE